jgi:hypothetical protein
VHALGAGPHRSYRVQGLDALQSASGGPTCWAGEPFHADALQLRQLCRRPVRGRGGPRVGTTAGPTVDPKRGGYEIVDKFAGKETFISGSLAVRFRAGVDALIETSPSEEEIDDYLEGFSALMQQRLVLH